MCIRDSSITVLGNLSCVILFVCPYHCNLFCSNNIPFFLIFLFSSILGKFKFSKYEVLKIRLCYHKVKTILFHLGEDARAFLVTLLPRVRCTHMLCPLLPIVYNAINVHTYTECATRK